VSKRRPSALEAEFVRQFKALHLPPAVAEYRFCERRWRVDFAWPSAKPPVAVEIEGFGHHKLNRYRSDVEKYNHLAIAGWILIRITAPMLNDLSWEPLLRQALKLEALP